MGVGCVRVESGGTDRLPELRPPASTPVAHADRAATEPGPSWTRPGPLGRDSPQPDVDRGAHPGGCVPSVRVISAVKPVSVIISASACARHNSSTTTDSRAPTPTVTAWPAAASTR